MLQGRLLRSKRVDAKCVAETNVAPSRFERSSSFAAIQESPFFQKEHSQSRGDRPHAFDWRPPTSGKSGSSNPCPADTEMAKRRIETSLGRQCPVLTVFSSESFPGARHPGNQMKNREQ